MCEVPCDATPYPALLHAMCMCNDREVCMGLCGDTFALTTYVLCYHVFVSTACVLCRSWVGVCGATDRPRVALWQTSYRDAGVTHTFYAHENTHTYRCTPVICTCLGLACLSIDSPPCCVCVCVCVCVLSSAVPLLSSRWCDLSPYLAPLWTMTFRVMDDIKESVRTLQAVTHTHTHTHSSTSHTDAFV